MPIQRQSMSIAKKLRVGRNTERSKVFRSPIHTATSFSHSVRSLHNASNFEPLACADELTDALQVLEIGTNASAVRVIKPTVNSLLAIKSL
jgi:hypothetical protein